MVRMATITVTHLGGDRFRAGVRGHQVVVDQPHRDGGSEAGPSPTELFVTSLATCVGYYAARFLRRNDLPYDGLRVDCDWTMLAARPARVSRVRLAVTTPGEVPADLREPLREAMDECTVHNSLRHPPQVVLTLEADRPVDVSAARSRGDQQASR
jgi:uncharacterized OsmC-like protein